MKAILDKLGKDFTEAGYGESWKVARRCYDSWVRKYPRGFWGVSVQSEYPAQLSEEDKQILARLLGVSLFTFRVDWITDIDEVCSDRIISFLPELEGYLTPGRWLHDYKTAGSVEYDLHGYYFNDLQAMAYPIAYEILTGTKPEGMIFHRVTKTAEPVVQSVAVPTRPEHLDKVRSFLQAGELLYTADVPSGIASNCRLYFRKCPHLVSGACSQVWKKELKGG